MQWLAHLSEEVLTEYRTRLVVILIRDEARADISKLKCPIPPTAPPP